MLRRTQPGACQICRRPFTATARRKYCSAACSQRAYLQRRAAGLTRRSVVPGPYDVGARVVPIYLPDAPAGVAGTILQREQDYAVVLLDYSPTGRKRRIPWSNLRPARPDA
jgi:hypothetical protein